MLVVSNGAFKSGSTWLLHILRATEYFSDIPDEYRSETTSSKLKVWVGRKQLKPLLDNRCYLTENYLVKGHYFQSTIRDMLLSYDGVYVLNIKRDFKDAIVSHFHHLVMQGKLPDNAISPENITKSFRDYYWRLGRYKAQQLRVYHQVWDIQTPKVYVSAFEDLKKDFDNEVVRIGSFLGFDFPQATIDHLKEKTKIENVQKASGADKRPEHKRFIRKGAIGEGQSYFTEEMKADISNIEQYGLSGIDCLKYHAIFMGLATLRKVRGR